MQALLDSIQGIITQVEEMRKTQELERVCMEKLLYGLMRLINNVEVDARIKLANISKSF